VASFDIFLFFYDVIGHVECPGIVPVYNFIFQCINPNTRKKVEEILGQIREKLLENDSELAHHGIKGQKWGVRNGPPYPSDRNGVDSSGKNGKIRMNLQMFAKIPEEKFTKYALDFDKQPDKQRDYYV